MSKCQHILLAGFKRQGKATKHQTYVRDFKCCRHMSPAQLVSLGPYQIGKLLQASGSNQATTFFDGDMAVACAQGCLTEEHRFDSDVLAKAENHEFETA